MKRPHAKIPLRVLVQTLAIGAVVGIPVYFVAFNQIRRACGDSLFGSREHFCSAHELRTWLLSFPSWTFCIIAVAAIAGFAMLRWSLRKCAS